jgi:hypothetical protein
LKGHPANGTKSHMPPSPQKTACRYHMNRMHCERALRATATQVKNPRCPKRADGIRNLRID